MPRFLSHFAMFLMLAAAGGWLWLHHAKAWDLGRRSPVLSYDAAQYAVAARELAFRGRLATTFALPIELARHPAPPWPLALVQPGLVVAEAALFRIFPPEIHMIRGFPFEATRPDQLEWIVLVIPFVSFIVVAVGLGLAVSHILRRYHSSVGIGTRALAGTVTGLAFLLDPEAQHFAVGGFTELPFTLGLVGAAAALALRIAPRLPFLFGLELGATGSFRGTMLWLMPCFVLGSVAAAPSGRRLRVLLLTLAGYALPLAPWWLYKWHAFGTPLWDLSALSVWDGVQGRTWFSIFHLPEIANFPHGSEAVALLAKKLFHNLPDVLLSLATGPLPLLAGALALWWFTAREAPRALRAAAITVIALTLVNAIATSISVPQLRYLFPNRALLEAAGLLALWGLVARAEPLSPAARRTIAALCAVLVLTWGVYQTLLVNAEARRTATERGVPSALTLLQIASLMSREIPVGEAVMSNLGPTLAWESRRPVIHLALSPDLITACRRKMDFRHVLLVFRDAAHAWPEWAQVVEHPVDALHHAEWNVVKVRRFESADGFSILWMDLGVLGPEMAFAR
ncbi:MAG: hypothetical protein HYR73_03865 [Candidatus Eisenbacteria bacterium]|nr:hypothetical protein [Candidatus Eisenbacteria bacterium]